MILRGLRGCGVLVILATAACSKGGEAGSLGTGSGDTEPPKLAGTWSDAVGDAPWRSIELTARDARHGHFAGRGSCAAPPCAPIDEGDYDLEGKTLRIHTRRLEGQAYVVQIGGDVMEWRQNDVMIRRFQRFVPSPEPPPREEYPSRNAARPPGTPCDKLTAQGCLLSKECVLEAPDRKTGGPYVCRAALAPCEGGMAQGDHGFAEDCKARKGCSVRRSDCYCPDARTKVAPEPRSTESLLTLVNCACGGGPYMQCLHGK